jgi:hypothetical protein
MGSRNPAIASRLAEMEALAGDEKAGLRWLRHEPRWGVAMMPATYLRVYRKLAMSRASASVTPIFGMAVVWTSCGF